MEKTESTQAAGSGRNTHVAYDGYRLQVSKKYVNILAIVVAVVNLALMIPDWMLITETSVKILVIAIRTVFTVIVIFVGIWIGKVHSFQCLSAIVTALEAVALAIFLIVMSRYDHFNFLIQTLGLVLFILAIFLIPNRTAYALAMVFIGSVGFFLCASLCVGPVDPGEFWAALVYVTFTIVLCAIFAFSTERHQFRECIAKSRLEHLSSTDFLTDTANRFRLEEEAGRWMNFCRRQGMPLSLMFIDVDNLKSINDRYGHAVGDAVLVDLARLFQSKLRSSDTLARWGGDEFVLLLPNASLENAALLMERIKSSVQENGFTSGAKITWSCGIVQMREGASFHSMLTEADALMYDGKHKGKDAICYTCRSEDAQKEPEKAGDETRL